MPRSLREIALVALVGAQLIGSPSPAVAATVSWSAFQGSAFRAFDRSDAVPDSARTFTREWSRSISKSPFGAPEWPATIRVVTPLDPAQLREFPDVTPSVAGGQAVYQWSTSTNGSGAVVFSDFYAEQLAPGFSFEREFSGGRDIAAGAEDRRTFTILARTSEPFLQLQMSITFQNTFGAPQPVTASNIVCDRPPSFVVGGSQHDWIFRSVTAGTDLRIVCDLTIRNTTTSPARYMPSTFVNAILSSASVFAPLGATEIVGVNDLGETSFTVTPPADATPQGRLNSSTSRLVHLLQQNETIPHLHWFAKHTKLLGASTLGDLMSADPQALERSWRSDAILPIAGPGWPAAISTRTSLPATDLLWDPTLSPVTDGTERVYTRTGMTPNMLTSVRSLTPEDGSVRATTRREILEGREVPAGTTAQRTLRVEAMPADTGRSLQVRIGFSLVGPVTVSGVSCPGARSGFFGPGTFDRSIEAPIAGVTSTLECTFTVTNASAGPARYMPQVEAILTQGVQVVDTPGATRFPLLSQPLGSTEIAVTPPANVAVTGHLDQWEERRSLLAGENFAVPIQDWSGTISGIYRTSTAGDLISGLVGPMDPHWIFGLQAPPVAWPAQIQVTTGLSRTLGPVPAVQPTTSGDLSTYTWSGATPFGSDLFGGGLTVDADLGFSAGRSIRSDPRVPVLAGGRLVGGGATETRELTITTRTTAPMSSLAVDVAFSAFLPPGAPPPPVTATSIACPGSTIGPSGGRSWRLDAPAVGTSSTFTCTFTVTNSSPDDALYMPGVLFWSMRSSESSAQQIEATQLEREVEVLGRVKFTVQPSAGIVPRGMTSLTDVRTANMFLEDRVAPRPTSLAYTGPTTATFPAGIPYLAARLTETRTGAPLGGRGLTFEVDGRVIGGAITDATGEARLLGPLLGWSLPAAHTVRASFAGNADHKASEANAELRILRRPTALEILSPGTVTFGFEPPLRARLTDESTGAPIADHLVRFQLQGPTGTPDGVVSFQAVPTDAQGEAVFILPGSTPPGTFIQRALFDGDADHLASSDAGPYLVGSSIGKVTGGGIRFGSSGRAGFNAQFDGTTLKGEIEFQNDTLKYHGTEIRAIGISADGTRASILATDADGLRARIDVEDNGEAGDQDRFRVRIFGLGDQNGDGFITGGTIQIHMANE